MSNALPCTCGRSPVLVETGYAYNSAWDGGTLLFFELRCPRWFFKCRRVKKSVSKSSPWSRWRDDLRDEWNAAVKQGARDGE